MDKKYYFSESINEELCFTLDYFIDKIKERGLKELEIYEAVRDIGGDFFYCQSLGEVCEKSEGGCGKECDLYEPRNGKNGICKEWRHSRTGGDKYLLTIDGTIKQL